MSGTWKLENRSATNHLPRDVCHKLNNLYPLFNKSYTDPAIAEIRVSESENLVHLRQVGAVGFDGVQSLEDLRNNWNGLKPTP